MKPAYLERLRDLLEPIGPGGGCPRRAETFNEALIAFRELVDAAVRAERGVPASREVRELLATFGALSAEREAIERECSRRHRSTG